MLLTSPHLTPSPRLCSATPRNDGFDGQIAAICRTRGAALATRNVKDFEETGIDVIDPWQPSQPADHR